MRSEVSGAVYLWALAALLTLPACAPAPPWRSGIPIPQIAVKRIESGKTTKGALLGAFGMPVGIAKRGEPLILARGNEYLGSAIRFAGFEQADAEGFFELFAGRALGEHHRVYYYRHVVSSKHAVVLGLYLRESVNLKTDQLWVLVNEESATVEDFVHLPGS